MKRLLMPLFLVFALLAAPIMLFADVDEIDEEIQKELEKIEESIKDISIPEIEVDLNRIQASVEVIEDIFDEDFPMRIQRKILKRFGDPVEFLDLDDETVKKIKELKLKHREEMIDYRSKVEKAKLELERILMEDRLDTRKLLSRYKEIAKLKEEIEIKKIEHKVNIYDLIPDDNKDDAKDILFGCHSHIRIKMRDFPHYQFNEDRGTFLERMRWYRETRNKYRESMEELREHMQKMGEKYKDYLKL